MLHEPLVDLLAVVVNPALREVVPGKLGVGDYLLESLRSSRQVGGKFAKILNSRDEKPYDDLLWISWSWSKSSSGSFTGCLLHRSIFSRVYS